MKAMLFAAGLGTRLKPFTNNHPKALAPINGKSLLELNLRYLQSFGIQDVVVNVHHFADQIISVLDANNGFGSKVQISDERDEVLETGGGLMKAAHFFGNDPVLVMNVDILTNLDLKKLIAAHQNSNSIATLAVSNRASSRQLLFDEHMQLCAWQNVQTGEKKIARLCAEANGFSFSGIQIINNDWVKHTSLFGKFSIIDAYLQLAKTLPVNGFDHSGDLLLDVGKPESLILAEKLFVS